MAELGGLPAAAAGRCRVCQHADAHTGWRAARYVPGMDCKDVFSPNFHPIYLLYDIQNYEAFCSS